MITFSQNPSQLLETKPLISNSKDVDDLDKVTCCSQCTSNYEKEAQSIKSKQLPLWLQSHCPNTNPKDELIDLKRKWNKLCYRLNHQGRQTQNLLGKSNSFGSSYPWWPSPNSLIPYSNAVSFTDSPLKPTHSSSFVPKFRRQQSCTIEFNVENAARTQQIVAESSLDSLKNTEGGYKEVKTNLSLGSSLFSAHTKQEKEGINLLKLLQENLSWQSEIIPSILKVLMDSKSNEKDTWLLLQGNDSTGKRRLALAIAESFLGSADMLLHISTRKRDNKVISYTDMIARASRNQEGFVVFVEDVDMADTQFLKFLAGGFETGKLGELSRRERNNGRAIFILTKSDSYEDRKTNYDSVVQMILKENETKTSASFGTTKMEDHKRKPEWDIISTKIKNPRIDEQEDALSFTVQSGDIQQDLSRQSSFNGLDLNIKAIEDDDEDKQGEFSPISSDLTREITSDALNPQHNFLDMIKNRFVFHRDWVPDRDAAEAFLSKIKCCFEEVFGNQNVDSFSFEQRVVEEVIDGSGSFVGGLFEKWLKVIFQTTLERVKIRGKEGIDVRLCFGGSSEKVLEDGFMGSCLPNKIHVSFMD